MERIINFVAALVLIIILLPIMALVFLLIKLFDEGPAIFKQARTGKDNKTFYIYKFRTMKMSAPNVATVDFYNADDYVTSVGKYLRKTSLDELPQLFNILNGTMSFVGPRPLILEEKEVTNMRTLCGVHKLTPGLTGWAQVNGRDNIHFEDKVKLDYEYLERKGFFFDLYIIFLTVLKVFSQSDINDCHASNQGSEDGAKEVPAFINEESTTTKVI